jgi:hypothetical protein
MRLALFLSGLSLVAPALITSDLWAQSGDTQTWRLEIEGQASQARRNLERAVQAAPDDPAPLRAYAAFLDRYRDPAARGVYTRLMQVLERSSAPAAERASVARRLAILDLLAGDRNAAEQHLAVYKAAGGTGLALPAAAPRLTVSANAGTIEIPGPLHSFERMAALSRELGPADVLPDLARNVISNGYQVTSGSEGLEQTEYLKLVIRYLSQARELDALSGPTKTIRIQTCDSTATGDLLRVLGYRMRGGCGSDVVLETVNASRAFLTIDSGFPLAQLEEDLRTNHPFTLDYRPTRLPILYTADYWQPPKDKTQGAFIDYFIADPSLCRLYLALSKIDPSTAAELHKQTPAARLKIYAHVLDFFGGMFEIRGGKAVVPGGAASEKVWGDLAGQSPDKGAAFFEKLAARDDGWLASYYDALARINGPVQDYLVQPDRLKRFYEAIRGRVTSPGPARPVFRSNTDMLLLTARLYLDPDGKPHLPGGIEVWKNLFANHPKGKYDSKLAKAAPSWKEPDDVLEAMFGLCRKMAENQPLKIFMALSDIDRSRTRPLAADTVDRLARDYSALGAQYPLFAEAPELTDKTILDFLDTAHAVSRIHDMALRADAAGTLQALAGLWQIFLRQGSIAPSAVDSSLARLLAPFARIQNEREVFDGGMSGVQLLFGVTHSPSKLKPQDRMMDLLAGAAADNSSDTYDQMLKNMIRLFEDQRLVSLDTLFDLASNLESVSHGEKLNTALAGKLATRIAEINLPRSAMTGQERNSMALGYWTEKHIDAQRKINLRAAIAKAANNAGKLEDLRGGLAPFLRDTLVGFNYIHYAPPGAEILRTNPLFVRSHDFIGIETAQATWKTTQVFGSGWPANAGGRLVGSLASLPYALAEAEQNFLVPTREQALIWGDLVPQMLVTAVIPRWWNVAPVQIHWVDMHLAYADALLAESAMSPSRRTEVETVLNRHAPPARLEKVDRLLVSGDVKGALENVVPSEMYLLADEMAPTDTESTLAASIRRLASEDAKAVSPAAISRVFGSPKPTLANSFQPELLNLRTFPTLMGYSSRILAESWESNLLYYGALADEIHASPEQMNVLVPEWTVQTVEQIFATNLEDWPALLRSLRQVGEEVRDKARKQTAQQAFVNATDDTTDRR